VGGTGTILVVEDEAQVRNLAREILESGGYTVLEADDGPAALTLAAARSQPFDLVLTDVVLPHLDGRRVHEGVASRCGTSRVLYMSGYAGSTVLPGSAAGAGGHFLQKPFSPRSLLLKVRDVLDAPAEPVPDPIPAPDARPGR
jgi:CheY-like chemotaxis protein